MKHNRCIYLLLLIPLIALWGCEGDEGPAGPSGADGTDGTDGNNGIDGIDGNVTCLECHNTDIQNSISLQYDRSGHALGEFVDYAGGRASCARCHGGQGFVEFVTTGDVDADFTNPESINCGHCHSIHATFEEEDYALRLNGAVPWIFDEDYAATTIDFGDSSNLCASCHQSRRGEPQLTNPDEATFEITSTHWGPHHGAQANVLAGIGFAEIAGTWSYPTSLAHTNAGVTCVTCHMGEYGDGDGGHTWNANLTNCLGCHDGAPDFNIGNVQTANQALLDELQALLLDQGVIEWVEEDEAYEPVPAVYTQVQAQAFFNWIGLTEDRSLGVHNPRYVEALLMNSIEAITPPSQ